MIQRLRHQPPGPNAAFFVLILVLFFLGIVSAMIARAEPVPSSDQRELVRTWGCSWFPHVEQDDWMLQALDRITNTARFGYDTNQDGKVDVVHAYVIEAVGSAGSSNAMPVLHATPKAVWFDLDHDGHRDVKLVDTTGNGACGDFRAIHVPQRTPTQRIEPTFDRKGKT